MDMESKVTIYTQVYNTKQYLEQCISGVLSQTYTNFEYIIVDNGCTDGSSEIISRYAAKDRRIRVIRFEKNQYYPRLKIMEEYATGKYHTTLDSDDWWEPNYLERILEFAEKNNLDLAVTGTMQYIEVHNDSKIMRKLEQPVVLTQKQFAQNYPVFWTFPSTVWATIRRAELVHIVDYAPAIGHAYGSDTMEMLQYIKQCSRIGIDNSVLYHYRIHPKGVTYQYNPRRFDANIAYYEQIKEFLELHQTFDPPKQEWLKRVHLSSMAATLGLLRDAQVTAEEKLTECARIVEHPLTAVALTNDCEEREQWFSVMWEIVFSILAGGGRTNIEKLDTVLRLLAPKCCGAVQTGNSELFAREAGLCDALKRDSWDQMVCQLMDLIVQKRYSKQYDLGQMLGRLIPPKTPLEGVTDTRFFREYADVCMLVLGESYTAALEQMTGLLLEEKKLYDAERFLALYLSLSALEEQIPAFLFGKTRLAWLYLRQNRREECKSMVDELTEMGLYNEELTELHQALEEQS